MKWKDGSMWWFALQMMEERERQEEDITLEIENDTDKFVAKRLPCDLDEKHKLQFARLAID